MSEDRRQKSEVRSQKSEVRVQGTWYRVEKKQNPVLRTPHHIFFFLLFSVLCLLSTVYCLQARAEPFNKNEEDSFYVAVKAFEDGFYDLSLTLFDKFLKGYLESDKKTEAMIYMGRCYFAQEKYIKALDEFETVLKLEGAPRVRDKVLFWLGEIYVKGKDYKRAASFYEELIRDYQGSYYLLPAYQSLAALRLKEGKFEDSLKVYQDILGRFEDPSVKEAASFDICEVLYKMRKYDALKQDLESFFVRYPASQHLPRAYFLFGESCFYLDLYEDAVEAYRKAEGFSGDEELSSLARLGRGWSYLKTKKYDAAREIFAGFPQESSLPAVVLGRAVLATAVGDQEGALSLFEKVAAEDRTEEYASAALVGKAEIYYGLSQFENAVVAYRTALDKLKVSAAIYDTDIHELRDKIYYGLAWAYLKLGDFRSAQEAFQKMVSQSTDKVVRLSALCQLADAYQDAGDYKKALETYQDFLVQYPDSIYADYVQYQIGLTWLKMGSIDSAVLAFRKLLTEFSSSPLIDDSTYFLGVAYFRKGDFSSARERLKKFLDGFKDSPYRPQALFLLGETLSNLAEYKAAVEVFGAVRECADQENLRQKAEFEAAYAYAKMGQKQEASRRLADFITRYPESSVAPDILFWLGSSNAEEKNYAKAKTYFERLIRRYPDHELADDAYLEMGAVFLQEGECVSALRHFRQAQAMGKNGGGARASLLSGDAYRALGDNEKALVSYEEAARAGGGPAKAAYVRMAGIYRLQKSYREAVSVLEKALSFEDGEADTAIRFEMAELLEEEGKRQEALEAYLKVYYLHPEETGVGVKALLRAAKIYEDTEAWPELRKVLEKVVSLDVPEAKFAKEKLEWLKGKK